MEFHKLLIISTFISLLFACGGSGESDSTTLSNPPTQSPTPPLANVAPEIVVKYSQPIFSEGRMDFDFSASTDSDGRITEFKMEQIAGPTATNVGQQGQINSGIWFWDAPSVSPNTTSEIILRITAIDDDNAQATRDVVLQVEGYEGPGQLVARFESLPTLLAGNGVSIGAQEAPDHVFASMQVQGVAADMMEIVKLGGPYRFATQRLNYQSVLRGVAGQAFSDVSYLQYNRLSDAISPANTTEFTVLSETDGSLSWIVNEDGNERDEDNNLVWRMPASVEVEAPCAMTADYNSAFGTMPILVGQRGKGMTAINVERITESQIANSFKVTSTDKLELNKSLCFLYHVFIPDDLLDPSISDTDGMVGGSLTREGIVALDYDANELVIISTLVDDQNQWEYEVLRTVPLNVPALENLRIVDAVGVNMRGTVPQYMIVVLAGETNESTHYLINIPLINLDSSQTQFDKIEAQTVYEWTGGIPVGVASGNFGGIAPENQYLDDLVVVTKAEFGLHFDLMNNTIAGDQPIFAQPSRFDISANASSMVPINDAHSDNSVFKDYILVAHENDNSLRVYNIP